VGGQPFGLELLLSALGRPRAISGGDGNDTDEGSGSSVPVVLVVVALAVLAAVGLLAVIRRRRA
jgi:MYXO-CTERM domain-containing protein